MNLDIKKINKYLTEYRVVLMLIAMFITFSLLTNRFVTVDNIIQVLTFSSIRAVVVCGQTMVIIGAGIDLSVGSLMGLCSVVMAELLAGSVLHPVLIILTVLAIGALSGLFNGLLIKKGKLDPFIVTLSTMVIFRGLALIVNGGRNVARFDVPWSLLIGQGYLFGIPVPILIVIVVGIIPAIVLTRKTIFGRGLYALGGNYKAAWLSGVRVDRIAIMTYVLTGVTVAISAIIQVSMLSSYTPRFGLNLEIDTILAAVIGGTSLLGGRGHIIGAVLGVLFVSFLKNGLLILGVNVYLETIIIGIVFITAVLVDNLVQQRLQKRI